MRISELSAVTGASPRSLRYYEQQGLISAERGLNGYREYGPEAEQTVRRIKALIDIGIPTETIREILPCDGAGPQADHCAALVERITAVRDRLASQAEELTRTTRSLDAFLDVAMASAPARAS